MKAEGVIYVQRMSATPLFRPRTAEKLGSAASRGPLAGFIGRWVKRSWIPFPFRTPRRPSRCLIPWAFHPLFRGGRILHSRKRSATLRTK